MKRYHMFKSLKSYQGKEMPLMSYVEVDDETKSKLENMGKYFIEIKKGKK